MTAAQLNAAVNRCLRNLTGTRFDTHEDRRIIVLLMAAFATEYAAQCVKEVVREAGRRGDTSCKY